ncbi:MAG: alpha/beta hydrolase family protein [Anaerolineae bacterium]|nr:alpha/beta hydrolase family protein [Anaerolineae bacterium]
MTTSPSFALQSHVDYLYTNQPRRLAFQAHTTDEFRIWQSALRGEVVNLLGLTGRTVPQNPAAEKLQAIDRGQYVEEKYALEVGEGVVANMYVLVPKKAPPYKAIMAFHGHNPSVQYILGNYPDDASARSGVAIDDNFAQALAQAGYLVCAVEQRGFGERRTDQLVHETSCRHLSFEYMLEGRTLLGERCWDGMCAISAIQNRPDVMPDTLGCTGHSGGGTTTLWLSAIDERITTIVTSCYFCSFKASILGMEHCECNYVPGILELGEMGDLAALLAPRPARFINGEMDPIFPVSATREQFETVQKAYALFGVPEKTSLTVHSGVHAYNHAFSHEWFGWWL